MAAFVLVHGAWEGGWIWKQVAAILRAAGHDVFTPTLTGVGERTHLLTRDVDLNTHIEDVLGVIKWERLENITLVGHSYGGMVVRGVADRAAGKIGSLIYLDAFLPENGQSLLDLAPPERREGMTKLVETEGDGWLVPVTAAPVQPVSDPAELEVLDDYCVPQPFATISQKINLTGDHLNVGKTMYILASAFQPSAFTQFVAKVEGYGWPLEELNTHHFTMLSMPEETADIFLRHAA